MASIKVLGDINHTSFEPGSEISIKFSIKGKIKSSSVQYLIRASYTATGATQYLSAYNYKYLENGEEVDLTNIPVSSYSGKEFVVTFLTPSSDKLDNDSLTLVLELIGNLAAESNGELECESEPILLCGKRSASLKTNIYSTNKLITELKIKMMKEEYLYDNKAISISVYVTNNPYDSNPIWEDVSEAFNNDEFCHLTNTTCDSGNYGVQIEFILEKTNFKSYIRIYEVLLGFI